MPVSGKYLIINVVYHIVVYFRLISCKSATAVKKLLVVKRNDNIHTRLLVHPRRCKSNSSLVQCLIILHFPLSSLDIYFSKHGFDFI